MNLKVETALKLIAHQRIRLLDSLRSIDNGLSWCEDHTQLIVSAIQTGFEEVFFKSELSSQIAVIATGGFARGEMAPFSDADITVVPASGAPMELDEKVREFFRFLIDDVQKIVGIQVSYAFRLISDCEGLDPITRSSLLDTRLIDGNPKILEQLRIELEKTHPIGEFLVSKIEERNEQMSRFNLSPLVSEPNLKEGAGGLRCFQTLNWLRQVLGEAPLRPNTEYGNLIGVRNLLHKVSARKNDLLSRTRQSEICDLANIPVDQLIRLVTTSAEALYNRYQDGQERIPKSRFLVSPGVYASNGEVRVEPGTNAGTVSVGIALATQLGVEVPRFNVSVMLPTQGSAFLHSLSHGTPTIENLDRCGILKTVLPVLNACRHLQSDDSVHTYTVYQHTLEVTKHLDNKSKPKWLQEIADQIADDGPLYLAALLHDVGKIDRSRPHSEVGAELAHSFISNMGLDQETKDLVVWLVRYHLEMTLVMRLRDLDNPQTINEFASMVGTIDRLNHLTLLTYADVSAVGVNVWTAAQETFLRTLYTRTLEVLLNQEQLAPDPTVTRSQVLRKIKQSRPDDVESGKLIEELPAHYLASTPPEIIQVHVDYVRKARSGESTIETYDRTELSGTEFTICAPDRAGLLSEVLGAIYAFELSCGGIRASTTTQEPKVILDVITASYRSNLVPEGIKRSLATILKQVIDGHLSVDDLLVSKGKDPNRKAMVLSWQLHEGETSILEIRSPRGRGVPFRLSRWIAEQGWDIQTARVGQWAGKAAATFYIQRRDGQRILPEHVLDAVNRLQNG